MGSQPDDSEVVAGGGPGARDVQAVGIILLSLYLLSLTLSLIWQLTVLWPSCDATPAITPDTQTSIVKVERLDPTSGSVAGGENVNLLGTGFEDGATVVFGDAAAKAILTSPSKIIASTPAHGVPEKVDVKVTNRNGSSDILRGGYTYGTEVAHAQAPETSSTIVNVTSIMPRSGDVAGGNSVQITGAGFKDNPVVTFGASLATEIQKKSSTLIAARPPAHSDGSVDVMVKNPDGTSGKLAAGYTYDSCLTQCRSRLPLLVLLAGALGGCFHSLRSLWMFVGNRSFKRSWILMYVFLPVNGAALAFIFFIIISAGSGFFSQPQGSNSCFWIIGIAALVGLFSQQAAEKLKKIADAFFAEVPPKADPLPLAGGLSVISIDPTHGPVAGETPVVITGKGFTKNTSITFGGKAGSNFKFGSSSSVSVNTPQGSQSGPVDVTATDPGIATKAVIPHGFTYE